MIRLALSHSFSAHHVKSSFSEKACRFSCNHTSQFRLHKHTANDNNQNSITLRRCTLHSSSFETIPEVEDLEPNNMASNIIETISSEEQHSNTSSKLMESTESDSDNNSSSTKFMAAAGLIIGTAVGPGILGLPAATCRAGLLPSTVAIIGCWIYVVSSILLVAEMALSVMDEQDVEEVSFTGLAVHTLGPWAGRVVAVVYAMLNYALLVACISGLGSIFKQWIPSLPSPLHPLICPALTAALICTSSFKLIHGANQILCGIMLVSITCLIAIGASFSQVSSWPISHWTFGAILPSIPVTVLTLGFHVITPVVCKVIGKKSMEARKVILLAGSVPLAMVLAWNAVVLSLAKGGEADPIKLLLSVSSQGAPAVQAFAFAALGTTLIGYALSFPRQLADTMALITENKTGYNNSNSNKNSKNDMWMLMMAIVPPAAMSIFHPAAFSRALDFAGVYANCFLFGFLPPVMAWRHRYGQKHRKSKENQIAPQGHLFLIVLIIISIVLGLGTPRN